MHCVASRFGYPNYRLSELSVIRTIDYPNYRLSELSLAPISSDSRRSTVRIKFLQNSLLDSPFYTEGMKMIEQLKADILVFR